MEMRTVNTRFLIVLTVSLVVLTGATYAFHSYQVRRQADTYLRLADQELESLEQKPNNRDYSRAIGFVQRYLTLHPENVDALQKLGFLLADHTRAGRKTIFTLENVLRLDPSRKDVRKRLVEVYLKFGRYSDALDHIDRLTGVPRPEDIPSRPPNSRETDNTVSRWQKTFDRYVDSLNESPVEQDLLIMKGIAHEGLNEFRFFACASYSSSIRKAPEFIDAYVSLANVHLDHLDSELDAFDILDLMISNNPQSTKALTIRSETYLQFRETAEAAARAKNRNLSTAIDAAFADTRAALKIDKEFTPAILISADCHQAQGEVYTNQGKPNLARGEFEKASQLLKQLVQLTPTTPAVYSSLARLELNRQPPNQEKAIEWLKVGTEKVDAAQNAPLLWSLTSLLIDQKQLAEAAEYLQQLEMSDYPVPRTQYLAALFQMASGNWTDALNRLDDLRPYMANWPLLNTTLDLSMGRCYEAIHDQESQLTAYQAALRSDPNNIKVRIKLAQSLATNGRIPEAIDEFVQMQSQATSDASRGEINLELARLYILKARYDDDPRTLERANAHLERIPQAAPIKPILLSEKLSIEGDQEGASDVLTAATEEHNDNTQILVALAMRLHNKGNTKAAFEFLEQAIGQNEANADLRLAQAFISVETGSSDAPQILRSLLDTANDFQLNDIEQNELRAKLFDLAIFIKDVDLARNIGKQLIDRYGSRIAIRLFDLSFQAKRPDVIEEVLNWKKQKNETEQKLLWIPQDEPLWNYGMAITDAIAAIQKQANQEADAAEAYEQALINLSAAEQSEILQANVYALRAELYNAFDHSSLATEQYVRAVETGNRVPEVIGKAISRLNEQGDFSGATDLAFSLRQLQSVKNSGVLHYALNAAKLANNQNLASEFAIHATNVDSTAEDHVWVGECLRATRDYEGAEKHLVKAAELAPTEPYSWIALIGLYADTDNRTKIKAIMDQAQKVVPQELVPQVLATGYEGLNEIETAANQHRIAIKNTPNDINLVKRYFNFSRRSRRLVDVERLLRTIVDDENNVISEDQAWSRLGLAQLLLEKQDNLATIEARELVEKNLSLNPSSPEDRRALAIVLTADSAPDSQQSAISLFRQLDQENLLREQDRYLLLSLCQREVARLRKAETEDQQIKQLEQITFELSRNFFETSPNNPRFIVTYWDQLLKHNRTLEAQRAKGLLEELSARDPIAYRLFSQQLAKLSLTKDNEFEELLAFIAKKQNLGTTEPQIRTFAAKLLEDLSAEFRNQDQLEKAERTIRCADELHQAFDLENVESVTAYATYLVRSADYDRAFQVAQHLLDAESPPEGGAIAAFGLQVRQSAHKDNETTKRLIAFLIEAARKHETVPAMVVLAETLDHTGQYENAVKIYRRVIERDPNNIIALNNLAVLLSLWKNEHQEALMLVAAALEYARQPALLDSKAMILLNANQPHEALELLNRIIAKSPTDSAISRFHRALAHAAIGNDQLATEDLKQAMKLGLQVDQLHPLEIASYRELEKRQTNALDSNSS